MKTYWTPFMQIVTISLDDLFTTIDEYVSNYDDNTTDKSKDYLKGKIICITDDDIKTSQKPTNYTSGPFWSQYRSSDERCGLIDKNTHAFHIKKLASIMEKQNGWIGSFDLNKGGNPDGNHRVRAVKYLRNYYETKNRMG